MHLAESSRIDNDFSCYETDRLKSKVMEKQLTDRVLVVCDGDVDPDGLIRFFKMMAFPVSVNDVAVVADDVDEYGAIVHLGHSEEQLEKRLGDRFKQIADEEWLLIAGEDEKDLHCTVEITRFASNSLRLFVRTLWARFCVP